MDICNDCKTELTKDNWYPSLQKINRRLCNLCSVKRNAAWRAENPLAAKLHQRHHYQRWRDKHREESARWKRNNPERDKETQDKHRKALRQAVLAAYGSCCACCGETRQEFLSVDHTNGDGAKHRKELKSRAMAHLYRYLRDQGFPKDRFRLLCYNCNMSRGHYGYCPHEHERTTSLPSSDPF